MKTELLVLGMVMGLVQFAQAGGNSSIVDVTVTSIKFEDEKIIIVGDGKLMKRVMSDAEHGDSSAFGQPAQMIHARLRGAVLEVIPYHLKYGEVKGVPMGGPPNAEMIAQSMEWWKGTLERAKEVKVGDKLRIGYQRERLTMVGLEITNVVGSGSLRVVKEEAAVKPEKVVKPVKAE